MPRELFTRHPLLHLLIPLAIGIAIADRFYIPVTVVAVVTAIAALAAFSLLSQRLAFTRVTHRARWRVLPVTILAMSMGYTSMTIHLPGTIDVESCNGSTVIARINSLETRERNMVIDAVIVDAQCDIIVGEQAKLHLRGCDYSLDAGDLISFKGNFEPIVNRGNPHEFDYSNYCRRNGIGIMQRLDAHSVTKVGTQHTLLTLIATYRHRVEHSVFAMDNLSPASRRLVIALTLGNSDYIERDTREIYSAAGIAHMLALSGLHIAILSMLVMILLYPLDFTGHRKSRLVITIIITLGYMFFTGLSPSVVRASILVVTMMIAHIFYRKTDTGNSLCIAASITLLLRPADLFHVGFLLSYLTVLTVSVASSEILPSLRTRCTILNYIISIAVISTVASLATAAATAYYFNTVSPLSVLSNVILMPLFPILMAICCIETGCALFGLDPSWSATLMNIGNNSIDYIAGHVATWSADIGSNVWIDSTGAVLMCCLTATVLLALVRHDTRYIIVSIILLLASALNTCSTRQRLNSHITYFLNGATGTRVLSINGNSAVVWAPYDKYYDEKGFEREMRGLLAYHGIKDLSTVSVKNDSLSKTRFQLLSLPEYTTIAVGGGEWKRSQARSVDNCATRHGRFILVTRSYHNNITGLSRYTTFDTVILAANIDLDTRLKFITECDSLGLPVIDLSGGALQR